MCVWCGVYVCVCGLWCVCVCVWCVCVCGVVCVCLCACGVVYVCVVCSSAPDISQYDAMVYLMFIIFQLHDNCRESSHVWYSLL